MKPTGLLGLLGIGAVVGGTIAVRAGIARWNRGTAHAVRSLEAPATTLRPPLPEKFDPAELAGLPEPVARYFDFALTPGQPLVRRGRLVQSGDFSPSPGRWFPFTATEYFSVTSPGFVWDAAIRLAPLASIRVRDSYRGGEGWMEGTFAGLVPVVRQGGTGEMASASLLRYLAEAPWFPTALLPSAGVRWEAVDEHTARATLSDSGVTVALDASFAADGTLAGIRALRHRDVAGTPVLTPWSGRFSDYRRANGMMVPGWSEIGWVIHGAWVPYWRGTNLRSDFEFLRSRAAARLSGG